ncbi:hypothetical protein DDE82_009109 [Stemphylium lycopersici]|uniref:HNH nuclease domain-containing protein n=1 Tax=Stemphylium lycopersici TaxID=183478 RepID=A0A364MRH5_STELY|nr:hypothetical protein TW65_09344 [Stemphylium lycopersici]RAQ98588.1 hypothetical protein DDE82_009109 [Stemphylium lycopersici]RAR00110.1 hypothetical protein DDE83_009152 [Stemphylium lycopersici]
MSSTPTLDDMANTLLLRADLHIVFDKLRIAFVPKPNGDGGDMRLVVYLLKYSPELERPYYNREPYPTASLEKRKLKRDTMLEHNEPWDSIASSHREYEFAVKAEIPSPDATPMKRAQRCPISPILRTPIQSSTDPLLLPLDSLSSSHAPTLPLAQARLNAECQCPDPYHT